MLRKAAILRIQLKIKKLLYKSKNVIPQMQKNPGNIFESLQVDPITGKYFLVIPEQLINELSWYEDTRIKLSIDGDELILAEQVD